MKHIRYFIYLIKHKWFVFVECCKLGIPLKGITHDLSKFLPSEWFPYTDYFYGNYPELRKMSPGMKATYSGKTREDVEDQFDYSWLYHQKRNKHHWQYWILIQDDGQICRIEMPLKYAKEMLADWIGTRIVITGKREVKEWYLENKHRITLHDNTRKWIENKLGI